MIGLPDAPGLATPPSTPDRRYQTIGGRRWDSRRLCRAICGSVGGQSGGAKAHVQIADRDAPELIRAGHAEVQRNKTEGDTREHRAFFRAMPSSIVSGQTVKGQTGFRLLDPHAGMIITGQRQPLPWVRVLWGLAFFSRYSIISPAMSLPVAVSTPSSPGEEFTSITTGP